MRAAFSAANSDWSGGKNVSFGGDIHVDSYTSYGRQGSGVWDLGLFVKVGTGYHNPQAFETTFGVDPAATIDAAFEIVVLGNGREDAPLAKERIDMNTSRKVHLKLQGITRLEIRYNRLKGEGKAVMIEPKVFF